MVQRGKILLALREWLRTLNRDQRWCILINADPDAMASASALKRIMASRTCADIYRINAITRPDNLAMLRYLHLNIPMWEAERREQYTHFAVVDSQPHHNKIFREIPFSVVIDHHPLPTNASEPKFRPLYQDIRPQVGATSTIMCEYLHGLGVRPSPTLATAMTLGIRTDTALFERSGGKADLDAYQWLSNKANHVLLRRIIRSEYLLSWLPLFAKAFRNLSTCRSGAHAWVGDVENADLLVAIADFFTRVHGLKWIAVAGLVQKETVVVIFRGDGSRDIGRLADACFYDVGGSAGGHRTLGRAEFPHTAVPEGKSCMEFIGDRLQKRKLRPKTRHKQG